jgi:hypothetical protein
MEESMKSTYIIVATLILTFSIVADAQRRPPRDLGTSSSVDAERRLRQLRGLEIKRTKEAADELEANVPHVYRRATKEETAPLTPPAAYFERYAEFLRKPGTGIITLNADETCSLDSEVVSASPGCAKYQFPGGGTSFSFRYLSYRIPRLSDITLQKNILKTDAVAQQGILVNLGDTPIEEIGLDSKGMRFLVNFAPAKTVSDLEIANRNFERGVESGGFVYRIAFFAKPNTTFALRSIAFPGKYPKSINGVVYDEFQFDKRDDIIVVFRIINAEQNGNLTVIWRELSRKDSPGLKR